MTTVLYNEFYNENAERNYPFEDSVTLTSTEDFTLPSNLFIDAMIYALDIVGVPYLAKIDMAEKLVTIADTATSTPLATGAIGDSDTITLYDGYGRQMGILTLGAGRPALQNGRIYEFEPTATRFSATCWFPLAQTGVQGFMLEDGTLITGDVMFEGRGGMEIHSYYLSTEWYTGRNILRFSAVGAINTINETTKQDCIGEGPPIKCIRLITTKGSKLIGSDYEPGKGVIAITPRGFVQETLCPARELPTADPKKDICDPPDPPVPEPEQPDPNVIINDTTVCVEDGRLAIVTPSSPEVSNPVRLGPVAKEMATIGWPAPTSPYVNSIKALQASQRYAPGGESSFVLSLKGYNE